MSIASTKALDEYNAFGPWVSEVRTPDDIPPLFAPASIDVTTSTLVLKFPRPESRRDLVAGMNLYDLLVDVRHDAVVILRRDGDTFATRRIALDEIAVLSSGADLLDGRLVLQLTSGETYSAPYNGSSSATVRRLVDTVRGLIPERPARIRLAADAASTPLTMPLALDELGRDDAFFTNTINDFALREPRLTLLGAHGRRVVAPLGGGLRRALRSLRPMTLHGAVLALTPTELAVLSRTKWMTREGAPAASMVRTVVSLASITAVRSRDHESYEGVTVITIVSVGSELELFLPTGSDAERALPRV
ncbi:hypothetical protein [Glaciihabitans sp. dw_435]|uniref:hypothetical protein n=1 Tax=Glaciihabitans sp. dw_435 TaxID=2720081 RepID=UPI001BD23893|nr:hypothetical protein [Glaciihabitans sp. dw_435]